MSDLAVCAGLVVFLAYGAPGQEGEKRPSFEVADVQPTQLTMPKKESFLPTGRVELPYVTAKTIIMAAYGVQENMITGGPKWLDTDRFDIVAKAPPNTSLPTLLLMVQSLLADQFQLSIHRDQRMMPGYALVRSKRPLKLQQSEGTANGRADCHWQPTDAGRMQRICKNLTMAELARQLPGWGPARIDLPVVDETEMKGGYDFVLEISAPGRGEREKGATASDLAEVTIFDAFEQVGLKLEQRKLPLQVIVIDHVEKPGAAK
jgi:uncharacterized protein (TIGR03435 family)